MKKFTFPLDNVLKYKERIEELEKNALGKMRSRLREISHQLAASCNEYELYRKNYLEKSALGISATELIIYHSYLRELEKKIEQKKMEVSMAEAAVEKQLQAVVALSKEKRSMEILKDKELGRYFSEVRREEEVFIDEFVMNAQSLAAGNRQA